MYYMMLSSIFKTVCMKRSVNKIRHMEIFLYKIHTESTFKTVRVVTYKNKMKRDTGIQSFCKHLLGQENSTKRHEHYSLDIFYQHDIITKSLYGNNTIITFSSYKIWMNKQTVCKIISKQNTKHRINQCDTITNLYIIMLIPPQPN